MTVPFYLTPTIIRVLISPHPCQHLLLSAFFLFLFSKVNLVGVKWYLVVVLICIFLMTKDVEHLFTCFSSTCIGSLEKCLFKSFDHFKIGLFVFFNY